MEKQRFEVRTTKSLYPPIEIVVNEKVYFKEVITPQVLDQVDKLEGAANEGDVKSTMAQLNLLCGVPVKVLMNVDVRDIQEMMRFISTKLFNPKKEEVTAEEKKSETGEDGVQS